MPVSNPSRWKTLWQIIIIMLPTATVGTLVGSFPGYKAYHYVWYDANFCTTCHVHDYATVGWSHSVHGQITTCHDCHHQRMRDYIREAMIMLQHPPKFPKDLHHTPFVDTNLCSACHVSGAVDRSTITGPMAFEDVEKIPKVNESVLHKIHLEKKTDLSLLNSHQFSQNERDVKNLHPNVELDRSKGPPREIMCADCHGGPTNRGHNFSSVDATCVRCHQAAHKTAVGQEFGCVSCHFKQFLIPVKSKTAAK